MPVLVVLAGPNGSGKTTLYDKKLANTSLKGIELVNPDDYAKRYGGDVKGGRQAILRRNQLIQNKQSFVTETTLSGNSTLKLMKTAKEAGYRVTLLYIGTNNPSINIQNVKHRVAKGGHNVPTDTIVRRHKDSLANLPAAIQIANVAHVFNNNTNKPTRIFSTRHGIVKPREGVQLPKWVPAKIAKKIQSRSLDRSSSQKR